LIHTTAAAFEKFLAAYAFHDDPTSAQGVASGTSERNTP